MVTIFMLFIGVMSIGFTLGLDRQDDVGPGGSGAALLKEDGGFLLKEDGGILLLE